MSSSSKRRKVEINPNDILSNTNKTVPLRKQVESSENLSSSLPNKLSMSCSNNTDSTPRKVIYLDTPAKSENDKKDYRFFLISHLY